jgi:hypothetical protein
MARADRALGVTQNIVLGLADPSSRLFQLVTGIPGNAPEEILMPDGGHAAQHLCNIEMMSRRLCPPYGSM